MTQSEIKDKQTEILEKAGFMAFMPIWSDTLIERPEMDEELLLACYVEGEIQIVTGYVEYDDTAEIMLGMDSLRETPMSDELREELESTDFETEVDFFYSNGQPITDTVLAFAPMLTVYESLKYQEPDLVTEHEEIMVEIAKIKP